MRSPGAAVLAVFGGAVTALTLALVMRSLGFFAGFMSALPFGIGGALLIAAAVVGFKRGRFFGLVLVPIWVVGVDFAVMLDTSGEAAPAIHHAFVHSIPWIFVVGCFTALMLNATA